ncbi:MAG: glycogen/starch/alpha-glucan phosphorylase, partial [Bacilli bacterium]|nr:glycogen/starch/alpha-glucan phosphorylase [Bacilli bacterium]
MEKLLGGYTLQELIENRISQMFGVNGIDATVDQIYKATATAVNDVLRAKRKIFNTKVRDGQLKRVYYLSMEFLMGKSLKNNLYNLNLVEDAKTALASYGLTLDDLYDREPDAALGNGGLGRLGACYLDSLSSLGYPAMGFSIRYEYGLFKQKIVDGYQTELPDIWLPGGEVWLARRDDKTYTVKFDGYVEEKTIDGKIVYDYKDYNEVEALPYDMMV